MFHTGMAYIYILQATEADGINLRTAYVSSLFVDVAIPVSPLLILTRQNFFVGEMKMLLGETSPLNCQHYRSQR